MCGSGINTNRFPERVPKAQGSRGVGGHAPPGNSGSSESLRHDIGQFHSPRIELCKLADYFIS